jgi:non-heme chloroperoxidase
MAALLQLDPDQYSKSQLCDAPRTAVPLAADGRRVVNGWRAGPALRLALGGVERPRRVVRFARLMQGPVRLLGGKAVRATSGGNLSLVWLPRRVVRYERRIAPCPICVTLRLGARPGTGIPWFSHGGSSDLRYWEPQRKVFGARYRFVAYSRRFHGSGARPADGDDSGDAHKNDLLAIMRRLKAGPVHLVGFSTAIALRSTLDDPGLVRSLTIIQPNVPWLLDGDPEGETVLTWWRDENERARVEAAGDAERGAKLWFELVNNRGPNTFDAQPEPLRRMWLDNFNARRPAAPSLEPLTCEQLGAITTPTLAVAAEYGMPYSRRIVDKLAGCIPGSRLVVIPSVSHFMSYQQPDRFNDAVLNFVAEH